MAKDILKQRWVAKNGSVFVEEPADIKFEYHKKAKPIQKAIAFNVGQEVADHIVRVHNAQILE